MSYLDEIIDLESAGDTGDNNDLSIQPVGFDSNGDPVAEYVTPATFNRVTQNLRRRSETLRRRLQDAMYLLDYDRGLAVWSVGAFQLVQVGSGPNTYRLSATDTLVAVPTLSPGLQSGGRARGARLFVGSTPYAGVSGVNDLSIVASAVTTGQRGYADGDELDSAGVLSLGGNNIYVEVVGEARTGGQANVRATVTGSPRRRIRITYGTQSGGTTLAQLIAAINGDANLFGTEADFGLSHLIRASTTSDGSSTSIPSVPETKLRGGFDAEGHTVSSTQMTAFFDASTENLLLDGEGLGIGFPAGLVESGSETFGGGVWQYLGGRRQSLFDAPTDRVGGSAANVGSGLAYGNLFNTGRQPELIPNAIPIGKLVGDEFVFVDGTRLKAGQPAISISESFVTVARIAGALADLADATAGSSGAMMIGYGGSDQWHAGTADDATATLALPNTTVEAGLDAVVTQLSSRSTNSSGARRIGAEALTGSVTSGNEANLISLVQHSVRGQIAALINSTLGGRGVGVNSRVNEAGHRLVGADPLHKDFGYSGMPAAGAQMLRAVLHSKGDVLDSTPTGVNEYALMVLSPFHWDNGTNDELVEGEPVVIDAVSGNNYLTLTATDATRFGNIKRRIPIPRHDVSLACPVVVVKIEDAGPSVDGNGLYLIDAIVGANLSFGLKKLDGTTPNFTGIGSSGTLTFYNALLIGGEAGGTLLRIYHYNGARPLIKLGVGDRDQPFLDVSYNDGTTPGTVGSTYYGSHANWKSLRRTHGGATDRITGNILTTDDKTLLDGVETGAPVDASASHNHASLYAALSHASPTLLVNSLPTVISDLSNLSYTSGTAWANYSTTMTLAGHDRVAVLLEVRIGIEQIGTPVSENQDICRGCLLFGPGGTVANANSSTEVVETILRVTPACPVVFYFTRQIVVPLNSSGAFAMRWNNTGGGGFLECANIHTTNSTVRVTELGMFFLPS
jgi:hypothetical protein